MLEFIINCKFSARHFFSGGYSTDKNPAANPANGGGRGVIGYRLNSRPVFSCCREKKHESRFAVENDFKYLRHQSR